jgi:hypothetical protein
MPEPGGRLTPLAEERKEQRPGALLADAAVDIGAVMAGGLRVEAAAVLHRPHLLIRRAEIKPPDARERNGGGAHGAWLERHVDVAADEALRAEFAGGGADRQNFGVGGRVPQFDGAVAGAGQDLAGPVHHDSTHRHLAAGSGGVCLLEGDPHWLWQFQAHRAR